MNRQPLNQSSVLNAWAMYDWANSVFALTIRTAIFPIYYQAVTKAAALAKGATQAPYYVEIAGMRFDNSVVFSYNTSLAFLIVVLLAPVLSGIADYGGLKKRLLQLHCWVGALACMGLYFFTQNTIHLGLLLLLISTVAWNGSLVFYNAFLPEIATPDRYDELSAKGFALGYVGSVLLLIINLAVIQMPEVFFDVAAKAQALLHENPALTAASATQAATAYYQSYASRLAFLTVGVWWLVFSLIPFYYLPKEHKKGKIESHILWNGFRELKKVWNEVRHNTILYRYLWAFFWSSVGLQTTMNLASLFGAKELHLPDAQLIMVLLIIQLVAIAGAYIFAKAAQRWGNVGVLLPALFLWIVVCWSAYFVTTAAQFYVLAMLVGLIMGGTQSLMRSTYAKLIPPHTHNYASYFSFYDVAEKLSVVIGAFVFGFFDQITGSMRNSALALSVFFIAGCWIMFTLPKRLQTH